MLTETIFVGNYKFEFGGRKLNGVYVPTGTVADLVEIQPLCGHKKCNCRGVLRIQGLIKKDDTSIGKPFSLDLGTFPMHGPWEGPGAMLEDSGFKSIYQREGHFPTTYQLI